MTVEKLYMYYIGLLMYKFSNEMLRESFANVFNRVDELHAYNKEICE